MQCTKLFPFSFSECNFRGEKAEKFVRLKENARKGTEAFKVQAYPRRNFNIQALDGVSQNSRFAISFQVLKINSCVKLLVDCQIMRIYYDLLFSRGCLMGIFPSKSLTDEE